MGQIALGGWIAHGWQGVRVGAQASLHQDDVVQRRDNGEEKSSAQKLGARDANPPQGANLEQKDKKYGGDLRNRVGLAKHAGAKIAQAGNGEQNRASGKDRNVAAEDQNRIFPGN